MVTAPPEKPPEPDWAQVECIANIIRSGTVSNRGAKEIAIDVIASNRIAAGQAVRDALEEAAKIAERYGCGNPGCTACYAGAAAAAIRERAAHQPPANEKGRS